MYIYICIYTYVDIHILICILIYPYTDDDASRNAHTVRRGSLQQFDKRKKDWFIYLIIHRYVYMNIYVYCFTYICIHM
jgi:hypothetical protein